MKKILAVILVLMFLVSVLVGCTLSEIGYYNTFKGMMSMPNYSFSGTLSVDIDTLEVDADELGIPDGVIESIKGYLSATQIIYDGTVISKNNSFTFNLKEKTEDGTVNNIFNLMVDKEKIALNKDIADLLLFSAPGGTPKTVNGVEYIEYDLQDLIPYLQSAAPELLPYLQQIGAGSQIPSSLSVKISKLFDDFINITCDGLSFNNIEKIGDNSYQLSLKNGDIADMLINTLKYILSNPQKLSDLLLGEDLQSGFIGSLTQDEIDAVVGSIFGDFGPSLTKQDLQAAVSAMLSEFPTGQDLSDATEQLDDMLASFKDEINSMFNYTLTNTLSKVSEKEYESDTVFTFETVDDTLPVNAKFAINMTMNVKEINPPVDVIPVDPNDDVPNTGC